MLVEIITCTTLGFVLGCIVTDKIWYKSHTDNLNAIFISNQKYVDEILAVFDEMEKKLGVKKDA